VTKLPKIFADYVITKHHVNDIQSSSVMLYRCMLVMLNFYYFHMGRKI